MLRPSEREYKQVFVDAVDPDEYLIVHLRLTPPDTESVSAAAARIAILTSLGTMQPLPSESKDRCIEHAARVLAAEDDGRVTLAFPLTLIGKDEGITPLFTILFYGASFNYVKELFIEQVDFPKSFLARFSGPHFGVSGLRALLHIPKRPPVGVILKPRLGVSLDMIAKQAEESLIGGVDFVVDDELMLDREGDLAFVRRVDRLMQAVKSARNATKEFKGYFVNAASTPAKATRLARLAHEEGVSGIVVNAFTMGFGTISELVEALGGCMPVIIHNMGVGILTRSQYSRDVRRPTGVSDALIAKLSRIVGGDAVHAGISKSDWYHAEAWGTPIVALRSKLHTLRPTFAVAAGGLTVANVWENIKSLGPDVMLEAGTGILGYPGGPRKAAKAFRSLAELLRVDMDTAEANETIAKIAERDKVLERELDRADANWRKG
jgi:2,3-diketo-5-methylthiopentyl-1-phosphate enolase